MHQHRGFLPHGAIAAASAAVASTEATIMAPQQLKAFLYVTQQHKNLWNHSSGSVNQAAVTRKIVHLLADAGVALF